MACGTPVITYNHASVPEIVRDGVTGFIVNNIEDMIQAVSQAHRIDPYACREHVINHFSVDLMIDRYLEVYQAVIAEY
jgi:glycosyltransferase involved in cell wall biosynthesis